MAPPPPPPQGGGKRPARHVHVDAASARAVQGTASVHPTRRMRRDRRGPSGQRAAQACTHTPLSPPSGAGLKRSAIARSSGAPPVKREGTGIPSTTTLRARGFCGCALAKTRARVSEGLVGRANNLPVSRRQLPRSLQTPGPDPFASQSSVLASSVKALALWGRVAARKVERALAAFTANCRLQRAHTVKWSRVNLVTCQLTKCGHYLSSSSSGAALCLGAGC